MTASPASPAGVDDEVGAELAPDAEACIGTVHSLRVHDSMGVPPPSVGAVPPAALSASTTVLWRMTRTLL